jgi:hypothetical protein
MKRERPNSPRATPASSLGPGPGFVASDYIHPGPALCPGQNPQAVPVMTHIEDTEVHGTFLRAVADEVLDEGVSFGEVLAAVGRLGQGGQGVGGR